MEKMEVKLLLSLIAKLYPRFDDYSQNNDVVTTWHTMLGDLDFDFASKAVSLHAATKEFPPSIAEIRKAATGVTASHTLTDGEAWGEVTLAVRRFGIHQGDKALAGMSEITRKCVLALGWYENCMTELDDLNTLRAHFNRYYASMVKRADENLVLPLWLRNEIAENLLLQAQPTLALTENAEKSAEIPHEPDYKGGVRKNWKYS